MSAPVRDVPKTYPTLEAGLTEFNRMFCYIRTMDRIVRLSDYAVFKPGPFAKHQYVNWLYEYSNRDGEKKYGRVAEKWPLHPGRNERDAPRTGESK